MAKPKQKQKMKIAVGLSGGVDSSVAALLLKEAGYDVFGLFMQNWHDTTGTLHGDCEWEEDRFVAELVARKIGIPFYFVDLSKIYKEKVVDYMFDEYAKGRTPNPDVMCNREIKFDAFLDCAMKMGADMVATGHYCRKETIIGANGVPTYRILAGSDPNKDQSYFLCQLSQEQLSKALFPIGHLLKPEVRKIAAAAELPSADKKDSQGICFVGKIDLPTFLQQKIQSHTGEVVEIFTSYYENCQTYRERESLHATIKGEKLNNEKIQELNNDELAILASPLEYDKEAIVWHKPSRRQRRAEKAGSLAPAPIFAKTIGEHQGVQFYTIGQRKGLNIGGHKESIFIIATEPESNTIYVGEGDRHPGLLRPALCIANDEIHWIRRDLEMKDGEIRKYKVRIRYRQPLQDAVLVKRENGLYIIFEQEQRGITPGQFAVWYDEDEMLGSGPISR
ncbi:MAG: tRNA 2-thiouridine(34) synthase MnmA [Bacteroidetes bacterium]|uniref:tRNA-specific 2-thiouridylase MnmA n=1 Tax=Candidatus Merdivivens pullicola TaxID=2840872 RepID=A0A9D9NH54_9BACT|nr:tRNA 2-thiouridine(34) synthase MnmA [Candidatus Merdivivens pullicola]